MAISKQQPMRPALEDVIDTVNDIGDIEPYITDAVEDWLEEHPEATTTVQDGSLTTAKYQDGSVTGAKIATNAITAEKIASGAVTSQKLADGAVTSQKLADGAVSNVISGDNEPGFTAGSAASLLGDAETASWMERTTAADGAALIDAIYGNTVVQDGSLLPMRMEGIETVGFNQWSSQLAIPASTYFPDGMRSAGTVRDELRADAAVTRVGAVDLGTLTWNRNERPAGSGTYRFESSAYTTGLSDTVSNIKCAAYDVHVADGPVGDNSTNKAICGYANAVYIRDDSYTDAAAFKEAMSGIYLYYELATPTTTPIDPPLPMSYRVGAGGTERVMVASGTQSAPPVFATRYPLDPTDLAASIAPRESATATTNHQVGDLIMLGWTLCKATQVIVTGETIEIGTNVTRTSVAAELAALS